MTLDLDALSFSCVAPASPVGKYALTTLATPLLAVVAGMTSPPVLTGANCFAPLGRCSCCCLSASLPPYWLLFSATFIPTD
ncbi:ZNF557, partial [Symbiodinium microadriaticum]